MEDSSFYHQQKKPQFPGQEQHLKCPRCGSTNTKFCYYNNYNLSQPRHFCKDCRRYWTKGGALRNIPVGGGIRKNTKRSSNTTRHSSSSSQSLPSLPFPLPQLRGTVGLSLPSFDQDRRTMEMSGSFSSLLASNGQFGNPFGSSTLQLSELSENQYSGLRSASVIRNIENGDSERVVGVQSNGESSCWNGGNEWPNLAIYTP